MDRGALSLCTTCGVALTLLTGAPAAVAEETVGVAAERDGSSRETARRRLHGVISRMNPRQNG